jgi:hypothetical protein
VAGSIIFSIAFVARLFAKAGVRGIMADPGGTFNPQPNEQAFVRFFAKEVEDYLRANATT